MDYSVKFNLGLRSPGRELSSEASPPPDPSELATPAQPVERGYSLSAG